MINLSLHFMPSNVSAVIRQFERNKSFQVRARVQIRFFFLSSSNIFVVVARLFVRFYFLYLQNDACTTRFALRVCFACVLFCFHFNIKIYTNINLREKFYTQPDQVKFLSPKLFILRNFPNNIYFLRSFL